MATVNVTITVSVDGRGAQSLGIPTSMTVDHEYQTGGDSPRFMGSELRRAVAGAVDRITDALPPVDLEDTVRVVPGVPR